MCGIAGIIFKNGEKPEQVLLQRMANALRHRGPDAEGFLVRGSAGLAHRRLSIIDLGGGVQPLCNENGDIWITFNGEIYNFKELRALLEGCGHFFKTQSDTEVIVHAYEQWGDSCVERFRGMFAFAILDQRAERLFLARDHLGIKPLYYLNTASVFAFASELQALRVIPGVSWELDLGAMDEYLALRYICAPRTIYRNVKKLPPASRVDVTLDGVCGSSGQYWQLEFSPNLRRSEDDTLAELDNVLRESVRAHLVADVPFGAFLSGGVDSSAIVAYMAETLDRPVKTFSIGFEDAEFNELNFAREAAEICHTEHHEEIVKPDALAILPSLVRHYGEPYGDNSAVPTYYLSQSARQHVPMVLSGDGGDECFAGYDNHRYWMQSLNGGNSRPAWKRLIRPVAERLMPWRFRPLIHPKPSCSHWLSFIQYFSAESRATLWRPEFRSVCQAQIPLFDEEYRKVTTASPCSQVQYLDIKTYLPNDILTKVDIASMMHGLEVRTPFVDINVMEFAATIPDSYNMQLDKTRRWEGKQLLKRIAERWYGADFVRRKKQGFVMPIGSWLSKGGASNKLLSERLEDRSSPLRDYFDLDQLDYNSGNERMWLILVLDEWLRKEHSTTIRPST